MFTIPLPKDQIELMLKRLDTQIALGDLLDLEPGLGLVEPDPM